MNRFFQSIDRFCLRLEDKLGQGLTSVVVGLILLGLAALFCSPRWELFFHGKGFSRLSLAPFDFSIESSLRFRILSPLLGYILFLKGALFKYLMLAALAGFHMLVYLFHRRKDFSPAEALGIGLLLSMSTLSFFQLYFPGYTDPVSYILILILLFYRERNWTVMICLTLLIFNHDNTIFLFPFLFFLSFSFFCFLSPPSPWLGYLLVTFCSFFHVVGRSGGSSLFFTWSPFQGVGGSERA